MALQLQSRQIRLVFPTHFKPVFRCASGISFQRQPIGDRFLRNPAPHRRADSIKNLGYTFAHGLNSLPTDYCSHRLLITSHFPTSTAKCPIAFCPKSSSRSTVTIYVPGLL